MTIIDQTLTMGDDRVIWDYISLSLIVYALSLCITLHLIDAPYGRHSASSSTLPCQWLWTKAYNARLLWFLQEFPALIIPVFLILFAEAAELYNLPNRILMSLYLLHYLQRSLLFPLLMKEGKPLKLILFFLAFSFCAFNGLLQARYLMMFAHYPPGWITDPRMMIGSTMFIVGMAINVHSDHILRTLRKPYETGYKIPVGGLFNYVSAANYFGEIVEWSGFALASWTFPTLAFAIFTAANLVPRATAHHRWYHKKFSEDYPRDRKAVIPYVW